MTTNLVKITKYRNRKFYDTTQSHYIVFEDIVRLVQEGKDIEVFDAHQKKDITVETLVNVLLKKGKSLFEKEQLVALIQKIEL